MDLIAPSDLKNQLHFILANLKKTQFNINADRKYVFTFSVCFVMIIR